MGYIKRFSSHSKPYPRFINGYGLELRAIPSHIRVFINAFRAIPSHIRGYGLEWLEKRFIYPIRVLSFWIKRGYDLEWLEKRFLYHIRVLSFWIKRGYDLENTFHIL